MHRVAVLFLLAPTLSIASDPLECVDRDFVQAFLSGASSSLPSYSTEIPGHFEVRNVPSDMRLVGSRKEEHATTAVFRSDRNVQEAYSQLASTLSDEGWSDITYGRVPSRRGFQSANTSLVAEYCREIDDTNLALIATERSGRTFISIQH